MMSLVFLIGTILVRNAIGKNNNHNSNNNCSQSVFDQASLNYTAYFNFRSKLIDKSCPSVKSIAFKKNELLEVEMKIQILNELWNALTEKEKIDLVTTLRSRFHFSCNSETIPTELCRTQYALDGGVYISTYDGSLLKHRHQKSCSVCLLKSNNSPTIFFTKSKISNSVIAYLNLSITDVVNIYDSADAEIVSVKFIRSPDNLNLESQYLLKSILQKDLLNYSISMSATLLYNIKVKLNSRKSLTHQKSSQTRVSNCIFRCDWSSICLTNASLLCNNKIDCLYGDDENILICKIFQKSNNKYQDDFKNKKKVNSKLLEDISQNKESFPLILSVILLSVVLICAGITIIVCFNVKTKHSNSTKKQVNHEFTNFSYDDPSYSSMYLNKSHLKNTTGPLIKEKLLMEFPRDNNHSNKCNSSIHQMMKDVERKNKLIEPNRLKQNDSNHLGKWQYKYPMIKPFDLCPQVSYPDPVTKSSWLRSYFQMTKIKNQMCVKAPLVVNISPVFFSCNN